MSQTRHVFAALMLLSGCLDDVAFHGDPTPALDMETSGDPGRVTLDGGSNVEPSPSPSPPPDSSTPGSTLGCAQTGGNWYVRKGASGANNGTSWTNAWNELDQISWTSVQPGDTVWLAGSASDPSKTYTKKLSATQSGTANSRICLQRVLASDSVPVMAAGWQASFDSPVEVRVPFAGANNESALFVDADYVTIDGRTPSGIVVTLPTNPNGQKINAAMMSGTGDVVAHIEAAGPGRNADHNGTPRMIAIYGNSCTSRFNYGHGLTQPYTVVGNADTLIEYDRIVDNGSSDNAEFHDDIMEYNDATRITIRYCHWENWQAEGVMMWNGAGTMWVYGNTFKDGGAGGVLWPSRTLQTSAGPVYFYNNTLINTVAAVDQSASSMSDWAPGSQTRNNIYWGSTHWKGAWGGWPIADSDYEFGATPLFGGNGAHSISNGTNPFVDYAGGDYQIVATVSATTPRDKGIALSTLAGFTADMARDTLGTTRGADGQWDVGAYEHP